MPSLTLGEAFVPGSDEKHFCKPTDVAVSSSGIFFVSDGYCNKRIMKFDPNGRLLDVYTGSFNIVHSLTLQEEKDALCVADREIPELSAFTPVLKKDLVNPHLDLFTARLDTKAKMLAESSPSLLKVPK